MPVTLLNKILVFNLSLAAAPDAGGVPVWLEFFTIPSINVAYVLCGCVILGISAGVLGCFAYLRKRSLMGDALAHAALPGVCMAFLLTGTKDPLVILFGSMLSCWLGAMCIELILRYTRCKEDSALGIVLSVFFGIGILMLTHIQQSGNAAQSGLDKFLFGQAASLLGKDVWVLGSLGVLMCTIVLLAYKEFKVVAFDPGFATAIGLPTRFINILMATLIVLAVSTGLQAVGVVLMAAMLVTPAAAARYWTNNLGVMLFLAGAFGALSGMLGAYISYMGPQMPTGPWMVVAVTTIFIISLFFAPKRGIIARVLRVWRFRRKTARENVLRTLFVLGEKTGHLDHYFSMSDMMQHRAMPLALLRRTLHRLRRRHWIKEDDAGLIALTEDGLRHATRVTRLHRLWEVYLIRKLEIAPDHVHDDAEEIEHVITPALEAQLAELLDHPETDPHQRPIPEVAGASTGERK
jgi:manganese/zinc/iron transport system permease protein